MVKKHIMKYQNFHTNDTIEYNKSVYQGTLPVEYIIRVKFFVLALKFIKSVGQIFIVFVIICSSEKNSVTRKVIQSSRIFKTQSEKTHPTIP